MGRVREEKRREKKRRRKKIKEEKLKGKKIEARKKVGKSRCTMFFPMILGSGRSKSRLAKAAGAEACGQMRDAKWHYGTPLWKHVMFGPLLEV